jgi:shikimate dehydrogenase
MIEVRDRGFIRLGLIGYPLGHSLSPQLHTAALDEAGLKGEYRLYAVAPGAGETSEIAALTKKVRVGELVGLNVTIPHKKAVMRCVDQLSDVARNVGAVNTIALQDGILLGENTDVPGFLHDLQQMPWGPSGSALVLGAGGSSRAVVYALASSGWDVCVAARRVDQAEALTKDVSRADGIWGRIRCTEFTPEGLESTLTPDCLIVNTTPLGMHPHDEGCPWPNMLPFPVRGAVYDLVYNPTETVLVRRARLEGLPALTGAGMLVSQAALSFQIWTGLEPPFMVMQKAFHLPQKEGKQ